MKKEKTPDVGVKRGHVEHPEEPAAYPTPDRGGHDVERDRGGIRPGHQESHVDAQTEWQSLTSQLQPLADQMVLAAKRLAPDGVKDAMKRVQQIAERLVEIDAAIRSGRATETPITTG